jgi:hypothetical protein
MGFIFIAIIFIIVVFIFVSFIVFAGTEGKTFIPAIILAKIINIISSVIYRISKVQTNTRKGDYWKFLIFIILILIIFNVGIFVVKNYDTYKIGKIQCLHSLKCDNAKIQYKFGEVSCSCNGKQKLIEIQKIEKLYPEEIKVQKIDFEKEESNDEENDFMGSIFFLLLVPFGIMVIIGMAAGIVHLFD